jgi:pimeloyl-ACP methyl ester carboxylesterase
MHRITRHLVATRFGQIHCRSAGASGPAIVLLHINQQSSALYLDLMQVLAPAMQVVAMDYPSHGMSDHVDAQPAIADYAECAAAVADHFGYESFTSLGEATGAAVAIELGVAYPRTQSVVLLNCPFYRNRSQADRVHASLKTDIRPADPSGFPLTRTIDFMLGKDPSHSPLRPTQSWMDRINRAQIEAGRHRWQALDALNAYDIGTRMSQLKQPTLLLMGEHFHYTPIIDEYRQRIAPLVSAEVIPEARFCMGWEKAEPIGKRVIDFVAQRL